MDVRSTTKDDFTDLKAVLEGTELFPAEMLPDMFEGSGSDDIWLSVVDENRTVGFCYAVPEQLAEGAWNMLAIAILPELQGQGHGKALVAALETALRERAARIVIADTSGTDEFAETRAFYLRAGYAQEATIRDFWGPGDDKVVFWKSLASA